MKELIEKFEWKKLDKARPVGLSQWLNNYRSVESYRDNSTRVERVGYTDFAKRLAKVQLAGENLSMYRAQEKLYDFTGEADFEKVDWNTVKVRQLGFGLSEYSEYVRAIAERQQELRARLSERSKVKSGRSAGGSSGEPSQAEPANGVPPSGGRGGAGGGESAPAS